MSVLKQTNKLPKKFIRGRGSTGINFVRPRIFDALCCRSVREGRKRCRNHKDNRFLRQAALRNQRITSNVLKHKLSAVGNVVVSSSTIRRRLNEARLKNRRPAKRPLLTREHRVQRLRFARDHQHWSVNDWKKVLCSEEMRVSLKSPDGCERVWRRKRDVWKS